MSAPKFVPKQATRPTPTVYRSPPRRFDGWHATRPGDHGRRDGARLGTQGPDQGYALTLAERVRDDVHLQDGEHWPDAEAVIAAVAMRRAALFGRAPVIHDVRHVVELYAYDDVSPPSDLVDYRRSASAELSHGYSYDRVRDLVDAVPESALRAKTTEILEQRRRDWRALIDAETV